MEPIAKWLLEKPLGNFGTEITSRTSDCYSWKNSHFKDARIVYSMKVDKLDVRKWLVGEEGLI